MSVFQLSGADRLRFDKTLSSGILVQGWDLVPPPKESVAHPITLAGGDGFYLDPTVTRLKQRAELFGRMFMHWGRHLVAVAAVGTPNPTATEFAAMQDVSPGLNKSGPTTPTLGFGSAKDGYECFPLATTKETTTWKIVRQQCEPTRSSTIPTSP